VPRWGSTRFLKRLHLDAVLGLSFLAGHEQGHLVYTDSSDFDSTPWDQAFDDNHSVTLVDVLARLRVDVSERVWLAAGYRWETWPSGEESRFSSTDGSRSPRDHDRASPYLENAVDDRGYRVRTGRRSKLNQDLLIANFLQGRAACRTRVRNLANRR
jgi:hypothetical protein